MGCKGSFFINIFRNLFWGKAKGLGLKAKGLMPVLPYALYRLPYTLIVNLSVIYQMAFYLSI